jgi:hypothetical protein
LFIDQIEAAIGAASGARALDDISRVVWRGLADGLLSDDDAQRLAEAIHTRRTLTKAAGKPVGGHSGSRSLYPFRKPQRAPVRAAAIERRRRLASSGPLPPSLAARFTVGELACLRIIADECREKGACTLPLAAIAARAGVCRKLAQNAVRLARREGLLDYQERRRPGQVSLTNVLTIVSVEWNAWISRGPRPERIGGKNSPPRIQDSRNRARLCLLELLQGPLTGRVRHAQHQDKIRDMRRNPRRAYDEHGTEIPPMTLGNMRAHGVRSIDAHCEAIGCGHASTLNVDGLPDELPVPDVSLKLRCSKCGSRSIHTRPNWLEMQAPGMGRSR